MGSTPITRSIAAGNIPGGFLVFVSTKGKIMGAGLCALVNTGVFIMAETVLGQQRTREIISPGFFVAVLQEISEKRHK